jgi:hypothetical protein
MKHRLDKRTALALSVSLSLPLTGLLAHAQAEPAQPSGLDCETPADVPEDQPLQLTCAARPELGAVAVVFFQRRQGRQDFAPIPALRTARTIFRVSLLGEQLPAGTFHYYLEARDAEDRPIASSGSEDDPHLLLVNHRDGATRTSSAGIRDDDPLAGARAERDAARVRALRSVQRPAGSLFVGLGAGYGYGAFPASLLEFRRDLRIRANVGSAGIVLLTPEVGYQLSEAFAVGLQLYWQQIGSSGTGDPRAGSPARQAFTALARGSYRSGNGRLQWLASAFLGAGQGFHLVVPPLPAQGLSRNDSVRAGPVVLGPGAGLLFHLFHRAALVAEARLLTGLPHWAALVDSRLAAEVSF